MTKITEQQLASIDAFINWITALAGSTLERTTFPVRDDDTILHCRHHGVSHMVTGLDLRVLTTLLAQLLEDQQDPEPQAVLSPINAEAVQSTIRTMCGNMALILKDAGQHEAAKALRALQVKPEQESVPALVVKDGPDIDEPTEAENQEIERQLEQSDPVVDRQVVLEFSDAAWAKRSLLIALNPKTAYLNGELEPVETPNRLVVSVVREASVIYGVQTGKVWKNLSSETDDRVVARMQEALDNDEIEKGLRIVRAPSALLNISTTSGYLSPDLSYSIPRYLAERARFDVTRTHIIAKDQYGESTSGD